MTDQILISPSKKTLYVGESQGKTVKIKAEYPQSLDIEITEGGLEVTTAYTEYEKY